MEFTPRRRPRLGRMVSQALSVFRTPASQGAALRRHRAAGSRALVDRLEHRTLLAGDLSISEFMASNTASLADEDGHYSDWIEIRNNANAVRSTAGYFLTDDAAQLTKWAMPTVSIPAGGHLVIFASGKNRTSTAAGARLHTNFSLNGDGEYLALVEPGGTTAATAFNPFPEQRNDISYGYDGATLRYFATPTPGAANVRAEVVINEIHYDPDVKTDLTEFVELHNPGSAPVNLGGAFFSDGFDYTFADGTVLAPGAYLVLAQNISEFQSKFGVAPFGQFTGTLSNEGEVVRLRNRSGGSLDMVDYGAGFPWPTVGDAPGYSIELINPDFDNSVGGNWRSHAPAGVQGTTLMGDHENWRYFKGTAEPSNPRSAWRNLNFGDTSWLQGPAPIGYDEGGVPMATDLPDMKNGYTSLYLRRKFNLSNPASFGGLRLEAMYDDGFNVWINGTHAYTQNLAGAEMAFDANAGSALESDQYLPYTLNPAAVSALRSGENVIAVQLFNSSRGNSSDAYFDARLIGLASGGPSPTPGRRNSVYATNAAPQMRHVTHTPEQPTAGQDVTITALVTDPDGVASVSLQYQLVDPGNYINIDDAEYQTQWTTVAMNDAGTDGDLLAGDGVYTAVLPASIQQHRRLVRYRIDTADTRGASITAPYADDAVPNFAYFVYDGVPDWTGAARPGVTPEVTYGPQVMRSLPSYHLLSKRADVEDATWYSKDSGDVYRWKGTLVYDGVVYDHISYRMRGGVWRYAMGKNMWKFNFNHNHELQARDDYGNRYKTRWDKLNLSAVIQQGDFWHRGEQGLFESVGFRLFNLAGVEGPKTNFLQFRIIDEADEFGASQYDGDLWGLYLAIEGVDGNFLDEHGLPDGNLYKMEWGDGELNNQGPTHPADKSDLEEFMTGYQTVGQTDQWFRDNMNLDSYYGYRTILEGIHHYDIDETAGKNYFFYHNPDTDKWQTVPWDLDLTWSNNMYGGGNEPFKNRVLPRAAFNVDFKNRIREIRNLLFNADQAGALIDEMAAKIYTAGQPSFVDLDRAMWDYNPVMVDLSKLSAGGNKAGQGRFYAGGGGITIPAPGGFAGMIAKMKAYVNTRGGVLDGLANDTAIPAKPTLTYIGGQFFPADDLRFRSSDFSDATGSFAAMEWRIAEVTNPSAPGYDPKAPKKYEIEALWESGELTTFAPEMTFPAHLIEAGKTYRVRVRMKDSTGRWSHWSDARQFVAGAPDATVKDSLRVTELHYHPEDNAAGPPGEDAFEFIELQNIGTRTINLRGVHFEEGIDYTFTDSFLLEPGQYVVVAKDRQAFLDRYGEAAAARLAPGVYGGSLDNAGERIILMDGVNQEIQNFIFDDVWHPTTDGDGPSMVVVDPAGPLTAWGEATGWRPSGAIHGSPGRADTSDTTAPTADVVDVTPDPRTTAVGGVTIVFSEPVTGFDLSDLTLSRGGGANLLTGAQTLTSADGVTWTLNNLASLTGVVGTYVLSVRANGSGIQDAAGNALALNASDTWRVDLPASVVGSFVFYNNSAYDGRNPAANAADDAAIATDKTALLPGQAARFANYTSYVHGLNGVMVDVENLPVNLTAADFLFRSGTSANAAQWSPAPAPASVDVRRGAGVNGSDRVTLTWADGVLRDTWLQLTVLANANTGLSAPHLCYFGNVVAETGNSATEAAVSPVDLVRTRNAMFSTSPIDGRYDFDRNGRVDALDLRLVRSAMSSQLPLLTAPAAPPPDLAAADVWDEQSPDLLA